MAKMKGGGAAVKGTNFKNEFPQPDIYTMPVVRKKELPPKGAPRYAKGGTVKKAGGGSCRGMGAAQRGGKYTIK